MKTREELLEIVKRLSCCLDENDDRGGQTHYVDAAGTIRAKGSFIALVQDAYDAIEAEGE